MITLRPEAVADKAASYKDVIAAATSAFELSEVGIDHVRVRSTATGARIMEVPGATSGDKADRLAEKLRGVVGELAVITRPVKTADFRVTGLGESATPEMVQRAVADRGQCVLEQVKVGAIKMANNGMGTAVVRCPVSAAKLVAAGGRLKVSWFSAGVQILEPLPMRCFKCMGIGHTRALCPSSVDRQGLCHRCGQEGHATEACKAAAPRCAVCAAGRRPAVHIMGSRACAPPPTKGRNAVAPMRPAEGTSMDV